MVSDDTQPNEIRVDNQSTRHPDYTDESRDPAPANSRSAQSRRQSANSPADGLTDRFDDSVEPSVTVSTESVTATLLGTPQISIHEYVFAHQLKRHQTDEDTRACALFDIENTSNQPIRWEPKQTSFVGSDGYTYQQAHLSLDPSRLGPGCHSRQVEIDPGCRARVMTLVERLPPTVEVAKVVHTVTDSGFNRQRLTFAVQ